MKTYILSPSFIIKVANREGKSQDLIISGKETLEVHRASSYDIFVRTESGGLVRLEKVNIFLKKSSQYYTILVFQLHIMWSCGTIILNLSIK